MVEYDRRLKKQKKEKKEKRNLDCREVECENKA